MSVGATFTDIWKRGKCLSVSPPGITGEVQAEGLAWHHRGLREYFTVSKLHRQSCGGKGQERETVWNGSNKSFMIEQTDLLLLLYSLFCFIQTVL